MTPKFGKLEFFENIEAGEGFWAPKFMNFLRWRGFHCLAAPGFAFQVSRRVVTP